MNKLLQHILQMEGYTNNQSVPKAQKGKTVFSKQLIDYKVPSGYSNISNDNILSSKQLASEFTKQAQAKAEIAHRKMLANRETVRSYDPEKENESLLSRLYHIAVNPMTALSYKTHGKDIPDHFERGEKNILESATNVINPFSYIDAGSRIPGNLARGEFAEAGLNALTVLPAAAEFRSVAPLVKKGSKVIKNAYNTVATGESALPVAWKSSAKELSQEASDKMFKGIANANKLSDADRALLLNYQYDSKPFTGRGILGVNQEKRQALNNIINNNELKFNNNAILTRRFNPENKSLGAEFINNNLNLGSRPTSFSAGIGLPNYNSGAVDRLVVPNRYAKKMGSNLLANEYGIPSNKTFDLLNGDVKNFAAARGVMADDIINAEREVIGTGLDFKRIGKVRNDIGGYDHIVKPRSMPKPVGTQEITRGPINYWEEPGFAKRNPNFNPQAYAITPTQKFSVEDLPENLMPFMERNLTKDKWKAFNSEQRRLSTNYKLGYDKYDDGGMIVDPMGQWAHPGKNTRIPGSDITMKGVSYPVLGIGSNGQRQMMQPGGEYSFGSAEHVDEYPMMQLGGRKPTLKEIMNIPMPAEERYEPSQGVKNLKAILSGIDLTTLPAIETPYGFLANRAAGIANSVGDAYTSTRYAMDGQWGKAGVDAGEAVLDLIPFAKGKRSFNLAKGTNLPLVYNKLSKLDKATNNALRIGKGMSYADDFHDVVPIKAKGGYVVTRSHDRKGKTHKVTGPDGTVKYFGDSKLGQHPNDPERKKAFYARHKKNLDNNPYFRAFARKTWDKGGEIDDDKINDDKEMLSGVADILRRINDTTNRKEVANHMMDNFRDEDVSFEPNAFLKSANVFGKGGEMIRRADGSYSRRGLWDNIRANKGSGKKPTKQMLEQERKIRSKQEGGEEANMPQSLEELMNPTRRGSASFGFGFNNEKFGTNYNYSGSDNLRDGTHSLSFNLPAFMKTGILDVSGAYSPGKAYSANLTGIAPANFIKKGAMMNFSGGYEKDISPGMMNVAPSYNMAAGFKIPTKVGNFTVNASYRK